jgi:hypothetical protein
MCETARGKKQVEVTAFVMWLNQPDDEVEPFLDDDVKLGDRIWLCRACSALWTVMTTPPRLPLAKRPWLALD